MSFIFGVMAGVMLFIHGLNAFSQEVTRLGGDGLRRIIRRVTSNDLISAITGAVSTALMQSSSAVTSMAVGLCHSGALTSRGAVGVMAGANVGTTLTAWLVAFKVTGLGPVFVTLGGLWSLIGPREWRTYGKPVFYFGLIFLALDEVASQLRPLAQSDLVAAYKPMVANAPLALLFGVLLSVLVQSSSVVTGLAVIVVSNGWVDVGLAAWLVAGANMGTSPTALVASAGMDGAARRLALVNVGINLMGLALFLFLLRPYIPELTGWLSAPGEQVAMVHTLFNLAPALITLAFLPKGWARLERFLEGREG